MAQGYDVLEITKGTWVEAIFAKKKELLEKVRFNMEKTDSEDGEREDDEEEELPEETATEEEDDEINENDDTFYSSFAPEAEIKDEEEEGFNVEDDSSL